MEGLEELKKVLEDPKTPEQKKIGWAAFVEGPVTNFFTEHQLEKMTLEDGCGNKAKLAKTKDNGIKIEYTSTITL